MDVVLEEEARSSQPSASVGLTESPCSTNNTEILPSSQEEASQSILVPVEGWLANPPSSGPQRETTARSSCKSGHNTLPPVVPDGLRRSGSRHRPPNRYVFLNS